MTPEPGRQRRRWRGPQRRIGLTGGMAMGKSTVVVMLSNHHGLPVLDANVLPTSCWRPARQPARLWWAAMASRCKPQAVRWTAVPWGA